MFKFLKSLCVFFYIFISLSIDLSANYELSICAIFRDDAIWLPEWIEFHQKQGVEHFYLYNNLSSDHPEIILKPYIDAKLVDLIDWHFTQFSHSDWNNIQCAAYMDCVMNHREDNWIAFLDTDEFLFSPSKYDLRKILETYENNVGVCVNWIIYGTSNVQKVQNFHLLKELVYRAPNDHSAHKTVKSIVHPNKVSSCINPHFFYFNKGIMAVTENKEEIEGCNSQYTSTKILRINHYWTRDVDFLFTVKLTRQLYWGSSINNILKVASEINSVFDPILADQIP